jgi:D-tyrosyl-tRNA(Tyr) deacylase|tara:strand:+ start:925 stop:1365 length:441 start_codon:yes stop_codon:yes gene_type:complete
LLGLIQRVSSASASIDNTVVGTIDQGLLLLLGIEKTDLEAAADKLLQKILNYRVFADSEGKMNLSLRDIGGELLVVSQFTLAADTNKGLRPSFSSAASPEQAEELYDYFLTQAATALNTQIQSGRFGADMQVMLHNDGPVTFMLRS